MGTDLYAAGADESVYGETTCSFSAGMLAMPELRSYDPPRISAEEFSELLEAALERLYESPEYKMYVSSGEQAAVQRALASREFFSIERGHPFSRECALSEARGVAAYASEHGLMLAWG